MSIHTSANTQCISANIISNILSVLILIGEYGRGNGVNVNEEAWSGVFSDDNDPLLPALFVTTLDSIFLISLLSLEGGTNNNNNNNNNNVWNITIVDFIRMSWITCTVLMSMY